MTEIEPTSHSVQAQGLALNYVDWGNATAPPLLLVHGGFDHCRSWDWVARALRHEFHVVAMDLRGHGDSAWAIGSSYPHTDFVYDVAAVIEEARLAPVNIIAHSMGGAVSLLYAGAFPENVARLVAVEGIVRTPLQMDEFYKVSLAVRLHDWVEQVRGLASRRPQRYDTLEQAVERMRAANPHLSEEQARHLTVFGMRQGADGTFIWKFDNAVRARSPGRFAAAEVTEAWSRIQCDTLLVRGAESQFQTDESEEEALKRLRSVRSVTVPGAGHWVHHDQLDAFLALVRPFLVKFEAPAGA